MKKIDGQTGSKERSVDIKTIMETSEINTFNKMKGRDFYGRIFMPMNYVSYVVREQLFLYNRVMLTGPSTEVLARDDNHNIHYGVNYASADYLGLAQHPEAKKAAIAALKKYGISSGNNPASLGSHELYRQLEKQLAEYWEMPMLIYPTGWMGGYGVIQGLIRPWDHVIMDHVCHNCLQEGAIASTKNILKFQHLNQDEMQRMVKETREKDADNAILVVTEGLFSMDADSPDLIHYQKVAKKYGAYLMIDCAHDFGHLGPTGKGAWEMQGLSEFSNVIMCGTGSKCLSTNIGFVGCKDAKVIELIRNVSNPFYNATCINPGQAATSLAQLHILRTQEGKDRRRKVTQNSIYLRKQLQARGHKIIGNPCAIMIVFIGNEVISRLVSRLMMDRGVHVNGIEYPVVKMGQARLRVCLLPQHTKAHMDRFVAEFEISLEKANKILDSALQKYSEDMDRQTSAKL